MILLVPVRTGFREHVPRLTSSGRRQRFQDGDTSMETGFFRYLYDWPEGTFGLAFEPLNGEVDGWVTLGPATACMGKVPGFWIHRRDRTVWLWSPMVVHFGACMPPPSSCCWVLDASSYLHISGLQYLISAFRSGPLPS